MKPKLFIAAAIGALILAAPITYALNRQATQLKIERTKINQLKLEIQTDQVKTQQQLKIKQVQQQQLQQQNTDLQKQLQAKNAAKATTEAAQRVVAAAVANVAPSALAAAIAPENGYKAFIYQHESGNNPERWNSGGCVGLGQACPASKLLAACPHLDYGCEDRWFDSYAQQRYGGWSAAYQHWLTYRNW